MINFGVMIGDCPANPAVWQKKSHFYSACFGIYLSSGVSPYNIFSNKIGLSPKLPGMFLE